MPANPHVIILMCDQMQARRMGFVDGVAHTPNLDRLAAEGIHFTNAFTAQAQCVPSRAIFQTGQYAHECGVMVNHDFYGHRNSLTSRHTTLGRVFSNAGYRTVYFGKHHLHLRPSQLGYAWDDAHEQWRADEAQRKKFSYIPLPLQRDYASFEKVMAFLHAYRPDGTPLCLTFSTNLPHPPFFTEIHHAHRWREDTLGLPENFHGDTLQGKPAFQKAHVEDGKHGYASEAQFRCELKQYYTMIAAMDEQMGKIMDELHRLDLWDDSIVMFFSDHGDMMGGHGIRLKGTLPYDELYRIPLLIKLPRHCAPHRKVIDDLVSSVQFATTIMQAAGIAPPATFPHAGFHSALFQDPAPSDADLQHVFFEHYAAYWGIHPFYGVRTRAWKYIRYYGGDDTEEMYDLIRDPLEMHNIAGDERHSETQSALAGMADGWWRDTGGRECAYYESETFRSNAHNLTA